MDEPRPRHTRYLRRRCAGGSSSGPRRPSLGPPGPRHALGRPRRRPRRVATAAATAGLLLPLLLDLFLRGAGKGQLLQPALGAQWVARLHLRSLRHLGLRGGGRGRAAGPGRVGRYGQHGARYSPAFSLRRASVGCGWVGWGVRVEGWPGSGSQGASAENMPACMQHITKNRHVHTDTHMCVHADTHTHTHTHTRTCTGITPTPATGIAPTLATAPHPGYSSPHTFAPPRPTHPPHPLTHPQATVSASPSPARPHLPCLAPASPCSRPHTQTTATASPSHMPPPSMLCYFQPPPPRPPAPSLAADARPLSRAQRGAPVAEASPAGQQASCSAGPAGRRGGEARVGALYG